MLTVHFNQNNSYEISINGYQVRKINEIRKVIFSLRYGKPSSALRLKFRCSLDESGHFCHKNYKECLNLSVSGQCIEHPIISLHRARGVLKI